MTAVPQAVTTPAPAAGPDRPPSARRRPAHRLRRLGLLAIATAVGVVIAAPIYFGVLGGFKDNNQLSTTPLALPSTWHISNYTGILADGTFWRSIFNSSLVALGTVVITVGVGALAGFVFARFAFRGREFMFMFFAAGLMFPPAVAILPLFVLLRELQMLNTPWGVVLPQAAFALPLTIIILRTFFRTVPAEIEESATLDGCSTFGVFWRIMLPMARPALAVVSVLALVTSWNNFLLPLVVLRDQSWWTIPIGVMRFGDQWAADTALVLAYTMLAMVPALAFFFLAERQLVAGIAPGAPGTKG